MNGCWTVIPSIALAIVAFCQWRNARKFRHGLNILHRAAILRQVCTRYNSEKRFWQDVFSQVNIALGEEVAP